MLTFHKCNCILFGATANTYAHICTCKSTDVREIHGHGVYEASQMEA